MERMKGIEPSITEWKSVVLPLHYIRISGKGELSPSRIIMSGK